MKDNKKKMLLEYPEKEIIKKLFQEYTDFILEDSEYVYEEIFPKVFVYKNCFSDIKKIYGLLKDASTKPDTSFFFKDWVQWGGYTEGTLPFGKYINIISNFFQEPSNEEETKRALDEQETLLEIIRAFFATTNHFIKTMNIEKADTWDYTNPSFCKYIPLETGQNTSMNFHTDYVIETASEPGDKFTVTSTMYINDDYKKGEIVFRTKSGDIVYKPVAGDVLVFPSGHPSILMDGEEPLMHAVEPISTLGPDRYMIRMFHYINSDGDNVKEILESNKSLIKENI
jgi:hypothetical protein